ncbi:hypothetical protein GKE62_00315 [Novosphingobium sp. Gsoil 351]|nr:hypothetical protein GKE62_00315 [Novosphingobium sp. Gsoil 351]
MTRFRVVLTVLWLVLAIYTGVVVSEHGLNLLPVFFGNISQAAWPGQFNLDFFCFLILSALWTAWRNSYSAMGLLLALLAFFGGAGFLLPYLLYLSLQTKGNMHAALVGPRQAQP